MNDALMTIKNKYSNPYIFVGGDFNRRNFREATREYPEIRAIHTGPTRGPLTLDIIASNTNDHLIDAGTTDPIYNENNVPTDHLSVYCRHRMPRVPSYEIQQYSYFHLDEAGDLKFGRWLEAQTWDAVYKEEDVSNKTAALHDLFNQGMRHSYEWKTRKKKSSEPCWMPQWLRDMIEDRRKMFQNAGFRSLDWKSLKKKIRSIVKNRKTKYYAHVLNKFESSSDPRDFYRNIDCLLGQNSKPRWTPRNMYPDLDDTETAERLAAFFNNISSQYSPLDRTSLPPGTHREPLSVSVSDVEAAIRKSKKKPSSVPGDINHKLYDLYPALLATPVSHIFSEIIQQGVWPSQWRQEYVTVIPKNAAPQDPGECRNISCTNYLSKLFEGFVLGWARQEITPKLNQYGGEPKASAAHLLVETMDYVTSTLEDNRAGVVLSTIDFSKAFNRLDHEHCLKTILKRGASTQVVNLLAAFLSHRTMTVKVGQSFSTPRPINAGAPQGSVLGCFLFNMGVDDLEEGFTDQQAEQAEACQETLTRTDDFPAVSTPVRVDKGPSCVPISPIPGQSQPIQLMPRVANVPPWLKKAKDPIFKPKPILSLKFVDDGVNLSSINMRSAALLVEDGLFFKLVRDLRTERLLAHITTNAQKKGMVINCSKTGLMCISAASSFQARVQAKVGEETVSGSKSLKILGVTLDSDCSFKSHIKTLRSRLRSKTWALAKLRKRGLPPQKLVKAYTTLIRPAVEYLAPVWHGMITAEQAADLERQQVQALKNIFGAKLSANKLRREANVELLSTRRQKISLNFARACLTNNRCKDWFTERPEPRYARRASAKYPKYEEEIVRTDRHKNSPKNFLRRLLNTAS